MVQPIYQRDIDRYRRQIEQEGVQGAIKMYADLQDKGHGYAGWAKGVAEASGLNTGGLGGTITGRAAVLFMKKSSGREFSQAELNSIRVGMAEGYLAVLERNVERGGGQTQMQVTYRQARDFHQEVFRRHRLTIDNWTLETPMKLIGRYEGGPAAQEAKWRELMKTEGDYADALFASDGLYGKVRDYADGYYHKNRSGQVVPDKLTSPYYTQRAGFPLYDTTHKISEADKTAAQKWLDNVGWFIKPTLLGRNQEGQDMGQPQYVRNQHVLPYQHEQADIAKPSLRIEDMPQFAQNIYHQGRQIFIEFCQMKNIPYEEKHLDNVAMCMAAAGYANRMRGVSMINIKDDGQILIGHKAPELRKAAVDMAEAVSTPIEESLAQVQQTARQFEQQELERQMAYERERGRGMSMS